MKKKGRVILFLFLTIILIGGISFVGITANKMVKEKYKDEIAKNEKLLKEREAELEARATEKQEEEKETIEQVDIDDSVVGESLIINEDTLSIKSYVNVTSQEEALNVATFLKENLVESNRELLSRRGVNKIEIILRGTEKSWKLNDSNVIEAIN